MSGGVIGRRLMGHIDGKAIMAILDSPGLPLFDWEICQKVISAALKAALILDGLQATHSDLSREACGRRGQKNTRPAIMVVGRMARAATRSILRRFSCERPPVPVLELNQCHPPLPVLDVSFQRLPKIGSTLHLFSCESLPILWQALSIITKGQGYIYIVENFYVASRVPIKYHFNVLQVAVVVFSFYYFPS